MNEASKPGGPRFGIVIVNWKQPSVTLRCLASLATSTYLNRRIVVVDNGSKDGSAQIIKQAYPDLDLIISPENLGFTGGNNLGIKYLHNPDIDYFLLLNNDAVIESTTLVDLANAALNYPDAGFLGPKILLLEEPDVFLSAGGFILNGYLAVHRGIGEHDQGQYNQPVPTDFLSGCALLVKRQAIDRIGLLDDEFFLYYEEVEWCQRAHIAGFPVLFVPSARVWHPDTRSRDNESAQVTYYQTRNSLLFARKTARGRPIIARMLFEYYRRLLSWSIRPKWRDKKFQRRALRQALSDYAHGRYGKWNDCTWA